jgi:transposase
MIAPYMPPPRLLSLPQTMSLRSAVDAMFYISATGCQWRMLPKDLPPYSDDAELPLIPGRRTTPGSTSTTRW